MKNKTMMKNITTLILLAVVSALVATLLTVPHRLSRELELSEDAFPEHKGIFITPSQNISAFTPDMTADQYNHNNDYMFAGPRANVPSDAPGAYGFWSFAELDGGKISRSGQPLISEFKWLKDKGWKSVIDLRIDGEYGETGDDRKLAGFDELGFHYLYLPISDGSPPSDKQAEDFLAFVRDPSNLPAHIHCRGGYGRTGTMVALYRYGIDGWPMDKAVQESRLFNGGASLAQKQWLEHWAQNHPHHDAQ